MLQNKKISKTEHHFNKIEFFPLHILQLSPKIYLLFVYIKERQKRRNLPCVKLIQSEMN